MELYEILLIICIVLFVVFIFGREIYRKIKKLPSRECYACKKNSMNIVKIYRKKYKKNN